MNRLLVFWDSLHSSYWFVPTILSIASIGLAVGMSYADRLVNVPKTVHAAWWLYAGDAQGARSVLSTIAGSIMTVTSVSFSITVAALSLASQQYGPRLLRGFLRDTSNQVTLGVLVGTFLYCLLVLRTIRADYIPNLSITLGAALAVASVGMLIFFIHHVTISIQADTIIENVGSELDRALERLYPDSIGRGGAPPDDTRDAYPGDFDARCGAVYADRFGYVTSLDSGAVLRAAVANDLLVEVAARPGAYAEPGAVLVRAYPQVRLSERAASALRGAFTYARQRNIAQDVAFGAHEMAEVAVRALSPGVNNPYTAIMVLDRLRTSLTLFAQRDIPSPVRRDEQGRVRVIAQPVRFGDLLEAAAAPIVRYGANSPMVLRAVGDLARAVRRHASRPEDLQALDDLEQSAGEALHASKAASAPAYQGGA